MSQNRIQVKLNGRRYEFAPDLAKATCTFFQDWYSDGDKKRQPPATIVSSSSSSSPKKTDSIEFAFEQQPDEGLDIFSFKFLPTLVPEYFGGIQVALRKEKMPPFKWEELNRAEQEAVSWIVNTFGMKRFVEVFGTPTAPVEVENPNPLYTSEGVERTMNQEEQDGGDAKKKKHPGMSAEQLASITLQLNQAKRSGGAASGEATTTTAPSAFPSEQQQTAEKSAAGNDDNTNDVERKDATSGLAQRYDADDSDDENLVLQGVGCFYCGTATHNTENCPNAPLFAAAEKLVQSEDQQQQQQQQQRGDDEKKED